MLPQVIKDHCVDKVISSETLHAARNILRQTKMIKVAFAAATVMGFAIHVIYSYYRQKHREAVHTPAEQASSQLSKVEENTMSLEQRVKVLSTRLESEVSENKSLWEQVEYLTGELRDERSWSKQLEEHCKNESLLNVKLENQLLDAERQLAEQSRKKTLLGQRWVQAERELEDLIFAYDELQVEYSELKEKGQWHVSHINVNASKIHDDVSCVSSAIKTLGHSVQEFTAGGTLVF